MAVWFTADTHFDDDANRRFFARPFADCAAMDAALLRGLSAVGPQDDLWMLGDFAHARIAPDHAAALFAAIPGRKHLVRGNHDHAAVLGLGWTSVHDLAEVEVEGQRFVLCHYPLVTWNGVRGGAVQLFGHVHTNWRGGEGQVNVGVEWWNFRPISPRDAALAALTLPENPFHREVEGLA